MTRRNVLMLVATLAIGMAYVSVTGFGSIFTGFGSEPVLWLAVDPEYTLVTTKTARMDSSSDVDVFEVTLHAGRSYKITMSVPSWADFDIRIYDENGNQVGSGSRGQGETESIHIPPLWTGTFYMRVHSYDGDTGSYTIKLWRKT
ncbi:MAG: pre-peptidase C-terminal domain-containing protein [Candidatus Bipolaricaulia bacterium]